MRPSRIAVGLLSVTLATFAGMFLPFLQLGVRNLPWEFIFGSAFYITWYLRGLLGERLEGLLGGILWPLIVITCVWLAASRVSRADRVVRVASFSLFVLSLAVCVPSNTANSLATRIPLYLNESTVRF